MKKTILSIESSCDDMAAAVCQDGHILSSVVMRQKEHERYGGVVPEVASRAHLKALVPGIRLAVDQAGIKLGEVDVIAATAGPGLLGSLTVGLSAAKGLAAGLGVPLLCVDHMDGHLMSPFEGGLPPLPLIVLTVSGGHSQITWVPTWPERRIVGRTLDDAAGEAFDKIGKMIGLTYPAGREIDELSRDGRPGIDFAGSKIEGLDMSFSGLKTQVRYFLQDSVKNNPAFIADHLADIAHGVQSSIVRMLDEKMRAAVVHYQPASLAVVGGVAANSRLRQAATGIAADHDLELYLPPLRFATDNAAMIALAAYHLRDELTPAELSVTPYTRQAK